MRVKIALLGLTAGFLVSAADLHAQERQKSLTEIRCDRSAITDEGRYLRIAACTEFLNQPGLNDVTRIFARINRLSAYVGLGQYEKALEDAQKTVDMECGNTASIGMRCTYLNRAKAFLDVGKYAEAIRDYNLELNEELKRNPQDDEKISEIRFERGLAYERSGQHAKAVADYKAAAKFARPHPAPLGTVKQRAVRAALARLGAGIADPIPDEACRDYSISIGKDDQIAACKQIIERTSEKTENRMHAYVMLAHHYNTQRQYEKAFATANAYLDVCGGWNPKVCGRTPRSHTLFRLKKYREAIDDFTHDLRMLEADQVTGGVRINFLFYRALAYEKTGERPKAVSDLKDALSFTRPDSRGRPTEMEDLIRDALKRLGH